MRARSRWRVIAMHPKSTKRVQEQKQGRLRLMSCKDRDTCEKCLRWHMPNSRFTAVQPEQQQKNKVSDGVPHNRCSPTSREAWRAAPLSVWVRLASMDMFARTLVKSCCIQPVDPAGEACSSVDLPLKPESKSAQQQQRNITSIAATAGACKGQPHLPRKISFEILGETTAPRRNRTTGGTFSVEDAPIKQRFQERPRLNSHGQPAPNPPVPVYTQREQTSKWHMIDRPTHVWSAAKASRPAARPSA